MERGGDELAQTKGDKSEEKFAKVSRPWLEFLRVARESFAATGRGREFECSREGTARGLAGALMNPGVCVGVAEPNGLSSGDGSSWRGVIGNPTIRGDETGYSTSCLTIMVGLWHSGGVGISWGFGT